MDQPCCKAWVASRGVTESPLVYILAHPCHLLSSCADGQIRVWDLQTAETLKILRGNSARDPIVSIKVGPTPFGCVLLDSWGCPSPHSPPVHPSISFCAPQGSAGGLRLFINTTTTMHVLTFRSDEKAALAGGPAGSLARR